jgi:hypothetical protein
MPCLDAAAPYLKSGAELVMSTDHPEKLQAQNARSVLIAM